MSARRVAPHPCASCTGRRTALSADFSLTIFPADSVLQVTVNSAPAGSGRVSGNQKRLVSSGARDRDRLKNP